MLSKRFTMIYLALTPLWFGLSWYISHRIQIRFMSLAEGQITHQSNNKPLIYASIFCAIYLGAYLVIRDLYKVEKSQ